MLWPSRPEIAVTDALKACSDWLTAQGKAERLRDRLPDLVALEDSYREAGQAGNLLALLLSEAEIQGKDPDKKLLQETYETALVQRAPGRKIYDALKAAAAFGLCALCGFQLATQLDHHAPKARFPLLALTPLNLIPTCGPCNLGKSNKIGHTQAEEGLHPYFDDLGTERWLYCQIISVEGGVAAKFSVCPPSGWSEIKSQRLVHHFIEHHLGDRYGLAASRHLSGRRRRDENLLKVAGVEALRKVIEDEAASQENHDPNDWETALLFGLAGSDWYLNGGMTSP